MEEEEALTPHHHLRHHSLLLNIHREASLFRSILQGEAHLLALPIGKRWCIGGGFGQ
jgi:hypothetical protein